MHKRVQHGEMIALLGDLDQAESPEDWAFNLEDEEWWELFRYDRYDWNDPVFAAKNRGSRAYRAVPTSQGFFFIVSPRHYKRLVRFPDGRPKKWYAKIDRDAEGNIRAVYAKRWGRKDLGEPKDVYAHREVMRAVDFDGVVDHINRFGLDCRGDPDPKRSVNLACVRHGENGANSCRPKSTDLPAGVEYRGRNRKGEKRYGGKICIRHSRKKVTTIRSRRTWLTPEPAARWYRSKLKRRYGRESWATFKHTVDFPLFPPLKSVVTTEEDMPF